ncbi:uncharacterized protein LOC128405730 isoform X1 [Podarcis raffonei]|uniref:uncharacterized protein LOC128405730 isoform X1 n=1 Tax=Podarcis raffonei TaxID=65483 RepID=UPI0023294503|nr:uncharacterized protein LOC128405730 isoform X1 [Podarcis raffonei]
MADISSSDEHHVTSASKDPPVNTSGTRTQEDELSDTTLHNPSWPPNTKNPHTTSSILCVPDEAIRRISTTTKSNSLEPSTTRYLTTEAQSRLERQPSQDEELLGTNENELVMQMTISEYELFPGLGDSFSQEGPGSGLRHSFEEQLAAYRAPQNKIASHQELPEEEEEEWKETSAENLPEEKGSQEYVLASSPPPAPMLPPPPAEGEWVTPLTAPEREWVPPPTPPQRGRMSPPVPSLESEWVIFERTFIERDRVTPLTPPTERGSLVSLPPSPQVLPVVPQPREEEPQLAAPTETAAMHQPPLPGPDPQPEKARTPPRQASEEEPLIPWASASNAFSVFQAVEKPEAAAEKVSKETSLRNYEPPMASRSGKEIVTQTETKALPARVEPAPSDMTRFKPKAATLTQRGKDKTFHDAMEDIASEIKDASTSSMANSINSFVDSPIGKVFANTIDRALEKSEEWLNYYLPLPDTSAADAGGKKEERDTSKDDLCKEGCFMRINFLSTQLRNRVFRFVLHRLKATRKNTNEQLSRLDQVLNMLDHSLSPGPSSFQKVSESLSNILPQWNTKMEAPSQKPSVLQKSLSLMPEQLEMKALTMSRVLADELYTTYRNLLPHVAELPAHLQEKVAQVYQSMEELHSHLSSVASLRDLPTYLILQSRERISIARENLDELLDFMAQSQPGQWLSQPSTSRTGVGLPSAGVRPPITGNAESRGEEEGSTSWQRSPPHPSPSYPKDSQL